jgi:uncharacterized membrane protein YkoI
MRSCRGASHRHFRSDYYVPGQNSLAKEERMSPRVVKIAAATVAVAALALGGAAWAIAGGGDEDPVTGPQADRAKAAALAYLGGGTAQEVERDDGGAAWEVEVSKGSREVEVHLDANYKVVSTGGDDAEAGGDDDQGGTED